MRDLKRSCPKFFHGTRTVSHTQWMRIQLSLGIVSNWKCGGDPSIQNLVQMPRPMTPHIYIKRYIKFITDTSSLPGEGRAGCLVDPKRPLLRLFVYLVIFFFSLAKNFLGTIFLASVLLELILLFGYLGWNLSIWKLLRDVFSANTNNLFSFYCPSGIPIAFVVNYYFMSCEYHTHTFFKCISHFLL